MLAVVSALFSACEPSEPVAGTSDAPPEPAPVNVTVMTLEPANLTERVELAGRLAPWKEVTVSTELGGTVQEIGFEKGRGVRAGQVLAKVGTDLLTASLEEAEAELMGTEAHFKKTSELFDRQAVPRADLISATSQHKRSQARVAQARLRVERSIIKAPISGIAVDREVESGEVVAPNSRITTIHQVNRVKAVLGIPEDDIAFFDVGDEAILEVDAYRGREFAGRVHFLSPAATQKNRSFPAEIDNRSGELRPGMIARVSLAKQVFEDAIVVPRDAVLERDTGEIAFVLEAERAVARQVDVGPAEQGRVVILKGLEAGEQLIVTGHRNLVDGQRVQPVDDSGL